MSVRLIFIGGNGRNKGFSLCEFLFPPQIKFLYLVHEFGLLHLQAVILLNQVVEVLLELLRYGGSCCATAPHKPILFKESDLALELGGYDFDFVLEVALMILEAHICVLEGFELVGEERLLGEAGRIGDLFSASFYFIAPMVLKVIYFNKKGGKMS